MAKTVVETKIVQVIEKKSRTQIAKDKARLQAKKFKRELKKAMSTAILAAFGFLIALVWKDVITEWVNQIAEKSPFSGKLFSAILVTLICVLGVMIITKLTEDKSEVKK